VLLLDNWVLLLDKSINHEKGRNHRVRRTLARREGQLHMVRVQKMRHARSLEN